MESGVLAKAFLVLETLAETDDPQPLGVVTRQLGLNKPTVHRILNDLVALGFVQSSGSGLYSLTGKLRRLAAGQDFGPLLDAAEPHLRKLHEDVGETVNLGVLRGTRVAYLQVLESTHPLRRIVEPGTLDPFHSTALGRAIVSRMPESAWRRMIHGVDLEARTTKTIVSEKKLHDTLIQARDEGFAVEREENDVGVMCVACPILEKGEVVVAAVSITIPVARGDAIEKKLVQKLRKVADSVRKDLSRQSQAGRSK